MDGHGNLFGTTVIGGINDGVVFELPSGSNTIQPIAVFNGATGYRPYGNVLVTSDGNLYGMTTVGGPVGPGTGTIYEIAAGSNAITVLASFNQSTGIGGQDALTVDGDGNLFGTSEGGDGVGQVATVFELASGSNSITPLASINGPGGAPASSLLMDAAGNLYGTTVLGGDSGYNNGEGSGVIFEVANGANSATTLSSFVSDAVADCYSGVVVDQSGNLYGVTSSGGTNNEGALFEVAAGSNSIINLFSFSFSGTNGLEPFGALTLGTDGNLYGTAESGGGPGNLGYGSVFEFNTVANSMTTLAWFNDADGSNPTSGIALDSSGDIFGTTEFGGANLGGGSTGAGTVWEIVNGSNTITVLASFSANLPNQTNYQNGAVALDSSGNFYGTTEAGGTQGDGTVYEVVKGSNTIKTLATFNDTNGSDPFGGVVIDGNGNLYGTTESGAPDQYGTIFEIAAGTTTIDTLAHFDDSDAPLDPILLDDAGNIFGTTAAGGDSGNGTLFELVRGSSAITTLESFNGPYGWQPHCGLSMDGKGDLFGTTLFGGTFGGGTVFELPSAATVAAPAISSFAINNGNTQRSMVSQLTVVFNEPVILNNAVSLLQRATGGGTPTPINFLINSPDGGTTWNLTFPGYTGGSLPDGIFDLTVTASSVADSYTGTVMSGGNQTFTFDRLFGDIDGNGVVNNADYFQFKQAYGQIASSPSYNAAFDYDANGIINNADYFQFKKRYGQSIVIAAETSVSPDAALLASSDSSFHKDKTSKLLL